MTAEKNRLCTGCGELVAPTAKFCEFCGQRLDAVAAAALAGRAAPPRPEVEEIAADSGRYLEEFDSRESARLSHEYFESHVELLKSHRKRLKVMSRSLDDNERRLNEIGRGQIGARRTQDIQGILEQIEGFGDEWEDLQLAYNRESEALDEDFQDRFAEMELDVELPEDLQESMGRELEIMTRSFDRIGERIGTLGTLGNEMIARAEGRHFGAGSSRRGFVLVVLGSILGWVASALWVCWAREIDLLSAHLFTSPALLAPVLIVSLFK